MITLDTEFIGNVSATSKEEYMNDIKVEYEANNPQKEFVPKEKKKN